MATTLAIDAALDSKKISLQKKKSLAFYIDMKKSPKF